MAGSYKLSVLGTLNNVAVQNDFYFDSNESNNTIASAQALASNFATVLMPMYLDCVPTAYVHDAVVCRGIAANNGGGTHTPPQLDNTANGSPGTRTGQVLSNQDGPVVVYYPALSTHERVRVCKTFLPGVTESDAGLDTITAGALLTNITNFFATLNTPLTIGPVTWTWVCLCKFGTPPANEIRAVTGYFVREFVASQNRRRP